MGDGVFNTFTFLHYELFNECSEGVGERGLNGIPMERMFVEMDRGGWGSDTWKNIINVRIVNTQICLHLYRLISLSFSPFRVSSKK